MIHLVPASVSKGDNQRSYSGRIYKFGYCMGFTVLMLPTTHHYYIKNVAGTFPPSPFMSPLSTNSFNPFLKGSSSAQNTSFRTFKNNAVNCNLNQNNFQFSHTPWLTSVLSMTDRFLWKTGYYQKKTNFTDEVIIRKFAISFLFHVSIKTLAENNGEIIKWQLLCDKKQASREFSLVTRLQIKTV